MKFRLQNFVAIVSIVISIFAFSQNTFAQTQRNPVLEEVTGTWCQWCPCGHDIMEQIQAGMPNAIMIGYHGPINGTDPFSYFSGNSIITSFGFSAYPTAVIDRVSGIQSRGAWAGLMTGRNTVPATVAIDVQRSFNRTTREFEATIDFTALVNLNGQYNFSVILLEDGIIWSQTGNGSCPGDPNYVHNHVVRDMMNGALGQEIVSGTWNQNDVITKTVNRTVPLPGGTGPDMVWDSCHVVVLAYKVGSPLSSNAEIQQAEEMTLIAPDYVITLMSSSPDLLVENNEPGNFTAVIQNQGLMDDSYYVDVTMEGPSGWTGEFTTPNGTFPFGQQDLVAVSAGDTLAVDVSVLPNVINGTAEITVLFTSMGDPNISMSKTFSLVTLTGVAGLVIDASGEGYADAVLPGMDAAFEYTYGVVTTDALYPSVDLTGFTLICWSSGNALPVFKQDEVNALQPFLDNGGRLLINGQDIGQDIFDASGQSQFAQSFYNNYLHANYVDDVGLTFFFRGIDGDPISLSNQFSVSLSTLYTRSPDQFTPYDASASSLFTFGTYPQYNSVRADDGTNRVVYFGFGLEQVSVDTSRDGLVERAINWLMDGVVLGNPNEGLTATSFELNQNYPNPFNPSTTISYTIPNESQVNLIVYDIMGRKVAELVSGKQSAGGHVIEFDASSLASGTYFYKLTAGEFISVKKMVLLK